MTDRFNLSRFVEAQDPVYDTVCVELAAGRKASHWMWFIFPQLAELGRSRAAQFFGLTGAEDAEAYDRHAILGPRLNHCTALLLEHHDTPVERIMGDVDALKLRSCATLFEQMAEAPAAFGELLASFYEGARCERTLAILGDVR